MARRATAATKENHRAADDAAGLVVSATPDAESAAEPTDSPHIARLSRLRRLIQDRQLEYLLVSNPLDVAYLTGFLGGDSYLIVGPSSEKPRLISDFRYEEELAPHRDLVEVIIRARSMAEAVAEVLSGVTGRIGFQADSMTVHEQGGLESRIGAAKLEATSGLIAGLRAVKDEHEVKLIRKAVKIQQKALEATLKKLKPGRTELEIAARLEAEMKSLGSREPGFQSIVAAGANGSLPHYRPRNARIRKGEPVLIDWGAVYEGYHSDMTRVVCLGKWPKVIKEIYTIVLEAQEAAAAALAPGRSTREIDAIARDIITRAGYGDRFGHGLGHGIGFNAHEEPRLTHMLPPSDLVPGHVVTVEPGIYLPGVGGVRIEDDYLITEGGARRLCTLPKDLDWASL